MSIEEIEKIFNNMTITEKIKFYALAILSLIIGITQLVIHKIKIIIKRKVF